jgi:sorbitol/mannitol transport system permease protein
MSAAVLHADAGQLREVQRAATICTSRNSLITSVVSTLIGLADRGARRLFDGLLPHEKTRDILMWMLSTKMMPAVGALVPIYVMAQTAGCSIRCTALIIVFTLSNLPIMVWMLYSAFKDIPNEILEAARMDGATLSGTSSAMSILPLSMGGIASTGLLCLVLSGTRRSGRSTSVRPRPARWRR